MLSDPDKAAAQAFGALKEKNMYGRKVMGIDRSTFIIKNGKIRKIFSHVKAEGHAREVLSVL